jgi:PAS domain S-box-containing protein
MMKEKNNDQPVRDISVTHRSTRDDQIKDPEEQIIRLIRENETLRRTEEEYHVLMDTLQEGVWAIDQEGYTTFVNPRMADMLGYSVDEMQGKNIFNYMDDRGKEIAARNMERRKQGIKEQHEFEFIKKDGVRIQTLLETGPITDENGHYRGAIAGVADITDRKKMEHDLGDAKKVWEAIFRGIGQPAVILDAHNSVIDANEAALHAVGKSLEELKKMKCWQIFHGKHISGPIQNCPFERMKRSSVFETSELYLETFGGYYLVSTTPIFDSSGNLEKVIHVATDINDRKRAEIKNQQLAAIVESSDDAIFSKSLDGIITSWNKGAEKIYGYTADEIIEKPITTIVPPDRGNELPEIMEKLNRGEHIEHYETTRIRKDGKEIPISLTISPIKDDTGNITGASTIARDITERKQAENMITLANHKLALMNDVSYQYIQNKVTALRGFAELSKEVNNEAERLAFIEKGAHILADIHLLIKNTQEYQEIGSIQPRWIPVEQSIRIAASFVSPKKGISIETVLPELELYSDPLLEKIFSNLIENAVIHGKTATRIMFSCEERPDGLILICEDDGVGISPDVKARLFDRSVGEKIHFGLFFVRECLTLSGMTIAETGKPGKGARFEITVPKGMFRFAGTGKK